jgi:membrane protein implicated in regulation of membrane protease activity
MPTWLVWLIVAGVLGVAEVLTLTLVLGMLSVAALAAAVASAVGAPDAVGVVVFAVVAVLLLGVVRPVARRHRRMPAAIRTGTDALVGRRAVVLEPVDSRGGRVKLGGEVWSARAYDETQVIPAGMTVDVLQIDGATAVVHSLELG